MQLVVGRIGRAHGVRGEVSVDVRTDDPDRRFAPGTRLETEPAHAGPLTVAAVRPQSGRLLVTFEGVNDRTGAEALRGTLLVADSATAPPPEDPEEFWDHDLVGLRAVTTDGRDLGAVADVVHGAAGDLLVLRTPDVRTRDVRTLESRPGEGSIDPAAVREVLVPFVAAIVPTVDLAAGRLVVDPPEGLLDL